MVDGSVALQFLPVSSHTVGEKSKDGFVIRIAALLSANKCLFKIAVLWREAKHLESLGRPERRATTFPEYK